MLRAQAISAKKLATKVGQRVAVIVDEGGAHAAKGRTKGDAPQLTEPSTSRRAARFGRAASRRCGSSGRMLMIFGGWQYDPDAFHKAYGDGRFPRPMKRCQPSRRRLSYSSMSAASIACESSGQAANFGRNARGLNPAVIALPGLGLLAKAVSRTNEAFSRANKALKCSSGVKFGRCVMPTPLLVSAAKAVAYR